MERSGIAGSVAARRHHLEIELHQLLQNGHRSLLGRYVRARVPILKSLFTKYSFNGKSELKKPDLVGGGDEGRVLLEKQFDNVGVVVLRCHVDGFLAQLIHGFRIGSEFQEKAAHVQLTRSGRQLQSRLFFLVQSQPINLILGITSLIRNGNVGFI